MFSHQEMLEQIPNLKRFAFKLSRNSHDAEDLLHSTIERALEKKDYFKAGTDFFKWSSKIMYNMFVSQYRRKVKFESKYDPEPYIEKQISAPKQSGRVKIREVEDAMKYLTEQHQEILILVCVKGMKYKEVARVLDIPVGTVRSRLSRARQQLEERLSR